MQMRQRHEVTHARQKHKLCRDVAMPGGAGQDHPAEISSTQDNFFNTARHTFSQSNSISALFLTMYGHVKS